MTRAADNNVQLGIAYMNKGQLEVALGKLRRALEQDPDLPSAHNAIAILYTRLGEMDQADRHYREALELDDSDSSAHNNYGLFLCDRKRYREAESHFMAAVKNPLYRTPLAFTNAGICVNRIPDRAGAERYFRRALELNPVYPAPLYQMARLSYEDRHYLQARGYLQRYQAVARHTAETLWLGVIVERQLGDKNAVSSYGLKLKANFPDSEETRKYREIERDS